MFPFYFFSRNLPHLMPDLMSFAADDVTLTEVNNKQATFTNNILFSPPVETSSSQLSSDNNSNHQQQSV